MSYERVGHCIYCGAVDVPLSDEHVVPLSLGGVEVVRDASCEECARITSQFELSIARHQLGGFRVRSDLPTRRKKSRPSVLPLELVDSDGRTRTVDVDPKDHPGTLVLPDLPEPSLILDEGEGRRKFRMFVAFPDLGVFEIPQEHGAHAMRIASFDIGPWYRLLAKVAHAGAYSRPGDWTSLWDPVLPDLVLARQDGYDQYVGGTGNREFDPSDGSFPIFYRSVAVGEALYLVAFFRLFAESHTPTYQVIVGRRREEASEEVLRRLEPKSLEALAVQPDWVNAALRDLDEVRAAQFGRERRSFWKKRAILLLAVSLVFVVLAVLFRSA